MKKVILGIENIDNYANIFEGKRVGLITNPTGITSDFVSSIDVSSSDKNQVGLITIKGFELPILKLDEDRYSVEYELPDNICAPIELNEPIGKVKVLYDDTIIYSDNLYSIEKMDNTDIKYQIDKIIQKWF